MRPALTVTTTTGEHRLLALLDDKPWEPVEGELWVASFPWELEPAHVREVELSVAPDVVLALPAPPARNTPLVSRPPGPRPIAPVASAEPPGSPPGEETMQRAVEAQQRELAGLRERLEKLEVELTSARAARDEALAARAAAIAAGGSEDVVALREELERLRATLAATLVECDDARRENATLRARLEALGGQPG